jgi:hypothetical protein
MDKSAATSPVSADTASDAGQASDAPRAGGEAGTPSPSEAGKQAAGEAGEQAASDPGKQATSETGKQAASETGAAAAAPAPPSGFRSRGRTRRRARFLRKARELAYRDLGGLVYDLHHFGQRNDALVTAKLNTLTQIDTELRALEKALGRRRDMTVLREAGVIACPRCAVIHSGEDSFCPNCGFSMSRHVDRPIAGVPGPAAPAAGAQGVPAAASGGRTQAAPSPPVAPAGPAPGQAPAPSQASAPGPGPGAPASTARPSPAAPAPSPAAPASSGATPPDARRTAGPPPAPAPPAPPASNDPSASPQPPAERPSGTSPTAPAGAPHPSPGDDEPTEILRPPAGGP